MYFRVKPGVKAHVSMSNLCVTTFTWQIHLLSRWYSKYLTTVQSKPSTRPPFWLRTLSIGGLGINVVDICHTLCDESSTWAIWSMWQSFVIQNLTRQLFIIHIKLFSSSTQQIKIITQKLSRSFKVNLGIPTILSNWDKIWARDLYGRLQWRTDRLIKARKLHQNMQNLCPKLYQSENLKWRRKPVQDDGKNIPHVAQKLVKL